MKPPTGIAAYAVVTLAYWAFMLTDGALRMLVLLHFHSLGFNAIQLAWLFLLYEFMGMVTNLSAGWIAARFGLTSTLYTGLVLQIGALLALTQLDTQWTLVVSVIFVMTVQGVSGIAKDLAKMSSKSAVKILAPSGQEGALFRWVALLTGSKNAVKGLGFLLGTALLGGLGFQSSILWLATALSLVLLLVAALMPSGLSTGRRDAKFFESFSKDPNVNRLSAARLFLFGARDTWFVVGIPIYFHSILSDGSTAGDRAAFFQIGSFMAVWIIGYGIIQAATPKLLRASGKSLSEIVQLARFWVALLTLVPALLAFSAWTAGGQSDVNWLTMTLVGGLFVFGAVFAVNSSLHSYLILTFTSSARVTMDVGFYYMPNAAGRLLGTLLSGLSYQFGDISLCLATAAAMSFLSFLCATGLSRSGEVPKSPISV